jgi:hypothetical protein
MPDGSSEPPGIPLEPSGRKKITNVVKSGDSSVGAGIRHAVEKANSYPFGGMTITLADNGELRRSPSAAVQKPAAFVTR